MRRGGRSQVSRPRLVRAFAAPAVTGSLAATLPPVTGTAVTLTGPSAGLYPNKPAGYTNTKELNFSYNVPVPNPGNSVPIVGADDWNTTYEYDGSGNSNFTRTTDATAPGSPPDVWRLHWAPGTWGTSHGAGNIFGGIGSTNHLYASMRFMLSPNYVWQVDSNKWILLSSAGLLVQLQTQGYYLDGQNNGGGGQYLRPGLTNGCTLVTRNNNPINFGVWHHFEMVVDIPARTWTMWLDGNLQIHATNLTYEGGNMTEFNMTGHRGGGGETIVNDMYWYLDHFHLAW